MACSCSKKPYGYNPFEVATRTPGPLGCNDAGSPDTPFWFLGDTPGALGFNDHAYLSAQVIPKPTLVIDWAPEMKKGDYDDSFANGNRNATAGYKPGKYVYELQQNLVAIGFKDVGIPDGDFGKNTEKALTAFQRMAKTSNRLQSGKLITVTPTYTGNEKGYADQLTHVELALWKSQGYSVPILTFADTKFRYQPTRKSLSDCIQTLPSELRSAFRRNIEIIITEMHKLGFAFGIRRGKTDGYRTFQMQYEINPTATKAGPGESFHNFACAVDLGVLEWVDEDGASYEDFWLGIMGQKKPGFSKLIWDKRNSICNSGVYTLNFEQIHMQSVLANTSGPAALVKCLNEAAKQAGDTTWEYKLGYECTLGNVEKLAKKWTKIGTAKNMWNKSATACTNEQKDKIYSHMVAAETIAKTIQLV
ncbi:MAG: M15 family metallopeptidase [Desulfuromonadaceae bacterium]|nr:M15 family metallopeptidase [Desulfuromonadaceae bacterium]